MSDENFETEATTSTGRLAEAQRTLYSARDLLGSFYRSDNAINRVAADLVLEKLEDAQRLLERASQQELDDIRRKKAAVALDTLWDFINQATSAAQAIPLLFNAESSAFTAQHAVVALGNGIDFLAQHSDRPASPCAFEAWSDIKELIDLDGAPAADAEQPAETTASD